MSMKVTKEQFIGVTYEELLAESEELLALNEHMRLKNMAVIGELQEENERLEAENAKLRELVERMARALGVGSNLCDRNCGWEFECDLVSCPIEEAMRELGIEVDDA